MRSKTEVAKKRSRKTKQLQSGNGKKPKSKFYEVLDECVATRKKRIRQWRKQMVDCGGDAPTINGFIEQAENELERIEAYRQRYERYQADRKVPRKLRKEIARLEKDLLQSKFACLPTGHPFEFFRDHLVVGTTEILYALFAKVDRIENPVRTENGSFKVDQCYAILTIEKAYDACVWKVLEDHFDAASERGKKKIVSPLPKKAEYLELKDRFYTRTLADLADEAYYGLLDAWRRVQFSWGSQEKEADREGCDVPEALFQLEEDIDRIITHSSAIPACVSQLPIVFHPAPPDKPNPETSELRAVAEAIQSYRGSGPELTVAEAKALDEYYERLREDADKIETFLGPSNPLESDD